MPSKTVTIIVIEEELTESQDSALFSLVENWLKRAGFRSKPALYECAVRDCGEIIEREHGG